MQERSKEILHWLATPEIQQKLQEAHEIAAAMVRRLLEASKVNIEILLKPFDI